MKVRALGRWLPLLAWLAMGLGMGWLAGCSGKEGKPEYKLIPVRQTDKWAYITPDGQVAVPSQFAEASLFTEGYALVALTQETGRLRYGFINERGEWAIEARYVLATSFSEGRSFVLNDDGTLWAINPQAEQLYQLDSIQVIRTYSQGLAAFQQNGLWGFLDKQCQVVIAPQFVDCEDFAEGLAPAAIRSEDGKRLYGYINRSGAWEIEPKFEDAMRFAEKRAAVFDGKQWGYIDPTGGYAFQEKFVDARNFSEGLAAVQAQRQGPWSYVDASGQEVVTGKFANAGPFVGGMAPVQTSNFKYGYIDTKGKILIKAEYDRAMPWVGDSPYALVMKGNKWGILHPDGTFRLPISLADVNLYHRRSFRVPGPSNPKTRRDS